MLSARVTAGKLPPVEERLPEEPMIVELLFVIFSFDDTLSFQRYRQSLNSGYGYHMSIGYLEKGSNLFK